MSTRIDGYQRIRAVLDVQEKRGTLTDILTGAPARFARGARLRFEFLLKHGSELADPSLISASRLRVLSSSDPDSALAMDKTIGPSFMNPGITEADWDTNEADKCHLRFEFVAAETAEGVFSGTLSDDDTPHWLLLTHGAGEDLLFAGLVNSFDAAIGTAGTPPTTGTAATLDQIRALLEATLQNYVKFTGNPAGATIELTSGATRKVAKIGADDEGNIYTGTQPTD